jgi:hypothetical protein
MGEPGPLSLLNTYRFIIAVEKMPTASLVTQSRRHALSVRGNDLCEAPPEATRALLSVEKLPLRIWEPAAGRGAIVDVLRAAGHEVVATDLIDYGVPGQAGGRDFLLETEAPAGIDCTLTNPPFRVANEFVAHALKLCSRVVILARLSFLESERRRHILENAGLARVYVFRHRIPFMHRDGWDGPKATSAIPYAWYCWDRSHRGPATVHRISWDW